MADLTRAELEALRLSAGGVSGPIKVHHEAFFKLIDMAGRAVSEETVLRLADSSALDDNEMRGDAFADFCELALRDLREAAEALRARETGKPDVL